MSESKEKPKLESHETSDTVQVTAEPESIKPKRPTTLEKSHQSTLSVISTDEEEVDDQILIDDGIPSEIPLEILAGPALILPESIPDIDGRTLNDEFDWAGGDDDDDDVDKKDGDKKRGALANSGVIICLSQNSSYIAWSCIFLFALILIAVDVAIFVIYHDRDQTSLVSYNLQLWFTWLAFMWTIGLMSQVVVEVVPWAIKKLVGYLRPQSTEVLRMRLSVR
jgi:hypothetical protein